MVGVGGVVIRDGRALLIRRGSDPLRGEWSIPGGMLEVGETLIEGVARELLEETGLQVKVLDLIEVFERIFTGEEAPPVPILAETAPPSIPAPTTPTIAEAGSKRPLYHFVILDYLCEAPEGTPEPGSDVTDVAFASESELAQYRLTPTATRVIQKAFALRRTRP